jgi:hypothetical protein
MEVVYETRGWRFIFSPQMSNLEDLEEAKEAMKKAQREYDEAKARFTEEWTTTHGLKLTAKYDKDMKSALKEEYENLARKEKIYNDLVNQSQGSSLF